MRSGKEQDMAFVSDGGSDPGTTAPGESCPGTAVTGWGSSPSLPHRRRQQESRLIFLPSVSCYYDTGGPKCVRGARCLVMVGDRESGFANLTEEKNAVTRSRIRRAAMRVLAQRGLRATVEEIAEDAGVSSRTVFRHYAGHDDLVADAIAGMYEELGRPVPGLPDPSDDLRAWLWRLALEAQARNAEILGHAFWDLYNPPPGTSEVILDALVERRLRRERWMGLIVETAWTVAGGTGRPPREIDEAFKLLFSAYATYSMATDFEHSPHEAATRTTSLLMAILEAQLRAH
jgi:AcrR family transcriptional regulator